MCVVVGNCSLTSSHITTQITDSRSLSRVGMSGRHAVGCVLQLCVVVCVMQQLCVDWCGAMVDTLLHTVKHCVEHSSQESFQCCVSQVSDSVNGDCLSLSISVGVGGAVCSLPVILCYIL